MARRISKDSMAVYRAIITIHHPARPAWEHDLWPREAQPAWDDTYAVGPYTTKGPAAAAITAARHDPYASGTGVVEEKTFVERGEITWKKVETK